MDKFVVSRGLQRPVQCDYGVLMQALQHKITTYENINL